jgi:Domain of unknown function (DUF397)
VTEPSFGMSSTWKSSSMSGGGNCVEVRLTVAGVQMRHSRNPNGPFLEFSTSEWKAFLDGVALGEFRLPGEPPAA